MALYEKVVQLLDARSDLKRTVVSRLGELHVTTAALRVLEASMKNSSIADTWIEADVIGSATTRHVLIDEEYTVPIAQQSTNFSNPQKQSMTKSSLHPKSNKRYVM